MVYPAVIHPTAAALIETLGLASHPEGGYFRETYRATGIIPQSALPPTFNGARNYATGIYFLLLSGQTSALHQIQSDEVWHFYAGSGLTVAVISPEGGRSDICLGSDWSRGEQFQAWVAAGSWFGAWVTAPDSYALVGCTVAPGFDFAEFQLAQRQDLLSRYPQHHDLIVHLTAA